VTIVVRGEVIPAHARTPRYEDRWRNEDTIPCGLNFERVLLKNKAIPVTSREAHRVVRR
jgi:hypothetical protein